MDQRKNQGRRKSRKSPRPIPMSVQVSRSRNRGGGGPESVISSSPDSEQEQILLNFDSANRKIGQHSRLVTISSRITNVVQQGPSTNDVMTLNQNGGVSIDNPLEVVDQPEEDSIYWDEAHFMTGTPPPPQPNKEPPLGIFQVTEAPKAANAARKQVHTEPNTSTSTHREKISRDEPLALRPSKSKPQTRKQASSRKPSSGGYNGRYFRVDNNANLPIGPAPSDMPDKAGCFCANARVYNPPRSAIPGSSYTGKYFLPGGNVDAPPSPSPSDSRCNRKYFRLTTNGGASFRLMPETVTEPLVYKPSRVDCSRVLDSFSAMALDSALPKGFTSRLPFGPRPPFNSREPHLCFSRLDPLPDPPGPEWEPQLAGLVTCSPILEPQLDIGPGNNIEEMLARRMLSKEGREKTRAEAGRKERSDGGEKERAREEVAKEGVAE